jgi:predicted RNA-binding protein YlqC (UPF0109 family)
MVYKELILFIDIYNKIFLIPGNELLEELVEYLLKLIVDFPDKLIIKKIERENVTILEIIADPTDLGKIIGKQGRVIKSLRTVINAATIKEKKRTIIEISEEGT